jgi:hypothetical protein
MAKIKPSSLSPLSKSTGRTVSTRQRVSAGKHPIDLYGLEDLYQIAEDAQKMKYHVNDLHNHFVKWFGGDDGGGLFSYRVATDLAAYIKTKLLENDEIPALRYDLSRFWKDTKAQYHSANKSKLGVASGTLADSIRAIKWSGKSGQWAVTVTGKYSSGVPGYMGGGKITDVSMVGSLLEFGMEGIGGGASGESLYQPTPKKRVKKSKKGRPTKKEKHSQPPRPWFYPAFHMYVKEKLLELTDKVFLNKYNQYFKRLAKSASKFSDYDMGMYSKFASVDSDDFWDDSDMGDESTQPTGPTGTYETPEDDILETFQESKREGDPLIKEFHDEGFQLESEEPDDLMEMTVGSYQMLGNMVWQIDNQENFYQFRSIQEAINFMNAQKEDRSVILRKKKRKK